MFTIYYETKGLPKVIKIAVLLDDESSAKTAKFIAPPKPGAPYEQLTMRMDEFKSKYTAVVLRQGHMEYAAIDPVPVVTAMLMTPGVKFSTASLAKVEDLLNMDTRGKSSEQIRKEIERIAVDLPKGHPLREVPKTFPDRGQAIAAYTAVRQALHKAGISTATEKESDMAKTKKVNTEAAKTETVKAKTKKELAAEAKAAAAAAKTAAGANGEAKEVAAEAKKKGGAVKAKADYNGKYVAAGEAAKVKTTEELGMHGESVRTKLLSHVLGSKAKNGVDYSALEAVGGDQTRGGVAYLVKKGYLARASA